MVLTKNHAEVTPKGYLEKREFNSFMVLDTQSFLYSDEKIAFGYSIEILKLIRTASIVNKMCLDLKSSFFIDTNIYHKAIDCVLNNRAFSDSELQNYFETAQKKEEFLTFSLNLVDLDNQFYLPYEVDYILLGMDMITYSRLSEDKREELSENYGDISCDMRFKSMEIKDFILKAKKLIADIKQ